MVKTKFKKAVSLMLAAVMSLTAFTGIGATTAFAAVGEKADVYLVDYPRSGDTNNNGEWGHGNLNYMNGWKGLSTKYTGLRAMGSYSGNIAYCIEPGTGQRTGDTLTEKDENFFNNISPNGTISGDDIRLLIGRILQYGYRGGISTSWKSQNESDANCIAHAYATQILIWETIVGERDAGFNHVSTSGYNAVLECVSTAHPLRSKILSYYNSMVTSVQNHTKVPSFCTRSSGSAKVNELEWNGSKYVAKATSYQLPILRFFAFKLYHKTREQFYRNFGIYEKSPNSFLPGLPHSIINQFCFHNLLCLCLASVHLPHPFHLIIGFQLLSHTVLLCQ